MTLPASISTGTVEGTWVGSDGEPCTGCVTFTPDKFMLRATDDAVMVHLHAETVELDETGSISQVLVATDNPDQAPWRWHARVELDGGARYTVGTALDGFAVPAGTTVNLADV